MANVTAYKYYDTQSFRPVPILSKTIHSEFLRTGRIKRFEDGWFPRVKRYYSASEVAAITARRLTATGERAHQKLNSVHPAIKFPPMIYHRIIDHLPHLGYCHVTASRTRLDSKTDTYYAFYFSNFSAEIGGEESFFKNIDRNFSRMYFAVAIDKPSEDGPVINRSIRHNGVIFKTSDPKEAMYNMLMLGAKTRELRQFVKSLTHH